MFCYDLVILNFCLIRFSILLSYIRICAWWGVHDWTLFTAAPHQFLTVENALDSEKKDEVEYELSE